MDSALAIPVGPYGIYLYPSLLLIALIAYFACSVKITSMGSVKGSRGTIALSVIGLVLSGAELVYTVFTLVNISAYSLPSEFLQEYMSMKEAFAIACWIYLVIVFVVLLASKDVVLCNRLYFIVPLLFMISFAILRILRSLMASLLFGKAPEVPALKNYMTIQTLADMQYIVYAVVAGVLAFILKKKYKASR